MTIIDQIKTEIIELINEAAGKKIGITSSNVAVPPESEMGDFSYACFELAKELKKNPKETAAELNEAINGRLKKDKKYAGFIERVQYIGPYLNFFIKKEKLGKEVISSIWENKDTYGNSSIGAKNKVMVEYCQPNTHKEFHVGHLRNAVLGNSLVNIMRANAYNIVSATYVNDFGSHVAKSLWAYLKKGADSEKIEDKAAYLSDLYVWATKEVAENEDYKAEIEEIQKKMEAGDKEILKIWKKTRDWSLDDFHSIYDELGLEFDAHFYESDFLKKGLKMVGELLKEGVLKESEGAVIADLSGDNMGVLVFIKSNGTTLYSVKDLPLAIHKFKKYKLDRSVYVVDVRQSLYFKQLFTVLKKAGYDYDLGHIGYEVVTLKEGMMSSRKGNVILYKDLREKVVEKLMKETRKRHEDWDDAQVRGTAEKIADAAMKFGILKTSPDRVIVFDINEAVAFDGFSGPYLQYTVARINSILRKAELLDTIEDIDVSKLKTDIEAGLIKSLSEFPETVKKACLDNDPSEMARYLFDLARNFSGFYHELPVIKAKNDICRARLVLTECVRRVMEKGMGMLGIEVLEEM